MGNKLNISQKILKRIRGKQRGWVFAPKDFLDIGSRASVDQTLSRLSRQGVIRRLDRGVYDFPKQHEVLGTLSPDIDGIARAITPKSTNKIANSGAMAANSLGFSTQVPAKPTYTTSGPSRSKKVAGRTVVFKRSKVPLLDGVSEIANQTVQALAYLGKENVDADVLKRCAKALTDQDLSSLISHADRMPSWITDLFHKIKRVKNG